MQRGFSLVELSIVLVILGLLTGGILSGQSLIRSAELRSVSADMARYSTAVYTFRDKYFALPGDMANATSFWTAQDPTPATCITTPSSGQATCNGNGDGIILGNTHESFRAWQHLANAGLIEGSYTGVTGPFTVGDHDPGVNAPRLRLGANTGTSIYTQAAIAAGEVGAPYMFEGSYDLTLASGSCGGWDCVEAMLRPEEAWNIDTKLDDGRAGLGAVVSRVSCAVGGCMPGCNSATSNAAGQAAAATYSLNNNQVACALYHRRR